MIVCICRRLNEDAVREAVQSGARCPDTIQAFHGQSFNCGKCRCAMADILDEELDRAVSKNRLVPAE
ncbi:MAG: (2Fe-2S)-binding protein [Pseudomonadota bacterium]